MYKGIEKGFGEKIGSLHVSLPDNPVRNGLVLKEVETQVKGETSRMVFPIYGRVDFIDTFGFPPYNEWAMGVDEFSEMEKEFTDSGTGLKEHYSCETYMNNIVGVQLDRKFHGRQETYNVEEMILPYYNASIGRFNVSHSDGKMDMLIERDVAKTREDITRMERKLSDLHADYLKKVKREEALPDIVISKSIEIEGTAPAVQQEMFPFWNKKEFDQIVEVIEIGYFDHGQNSNSFDERHGRWYKLFDFRDFDHDTLEIREGNWESQELEVDGEKRSFMSNYEKNLYKITENV